ncbi:MAG: trigger factor [Desulfobulbaceae bacterium]|nr:MAG: trigger factor [Desulfobulbaceae bacterium]
MEVRVEEISGLTRKITVTLPAEVVQPKLSEAYEKLRKDVKIKGFRKGKVPMSLIVKSYKPQVETEVGEKLVQDTYFDAIEKEGVNPVVHPELSGVNYNEDGSFTYIANVDTKPDFELGTYKGVEVEKEPVTVSEEEIEAELKQMQKNLAVLRAVDDRPIAEGDVVVVDFQGFHKGNAMKQVKNEDYSVDVGSGRMGREFEEKLVGMKKGEEATHTVNFPEKHPNPLLAGKEVEFRIKVKDIKERVLADFNDDFAKDVSKDFNTLDELKESIRARCQKDKEQAAEGAFTDRLMQKILDGHDFEVPHRLVAFEIDQMIKQTEQTLMKSGLSLEAAGLSREELAKQNLEMATKRVRGDFILKKIAEVEGIKVNDEDLERGFKRIGDQYNMTVDKVKEFFQSRDDLLPFMNELLNEKILHFLREEAAIVPAAGADPAQEA